jgi:hypothetical protein
MRVFAGLAGFLILLSVSGSVMAQSQACVCSDMSKTSDCCALKGSLQACIACAVGKGNPRDGATGWCRRTQPACRR